MFPRGPVFLLQPESIIIVPGAGIPIDGEHITAAVECFADGNPLPSYRYSLLELEEKSSKKITFYLLCSYT